MIRRLSILLVSIGCASPSAAPLGACADLAADGATVTGSTASSTDDHSSCGEVGGRDSVVQFTAEASGMLTVDTFGSDFDTVLSVVASCTYARPIDCNDDAGDSLQSSVTIPVAAGETYLAIVDGYDDLESGSFVLSFRYGDEPGGGEVGRPCTSNAECASGLCLAGADVCTETCADECDCPSGTTCTASDIGAICAPGRNTCGLETCTTEGSIECRGDTEVRCDGGVVMERDCVDHCASLGLEVTYGCSETTGCRCASWPGRSGCSSGAGMCGTLEDGTPFSARCVAAGSRTVWRGYDCQDICVRDGWEQATGCELRSGDPVCLCCTGDECPSCIGPDCVCRATHQELTNCGENSTRTVCRAGVGSLSECRRIFQNDSTSAAHCTWTDQYSNHRIESGPCP